MGTNRPGWLVLEIELLPRQEELAGAVMQELGTMGCETVAAGEGRSHLRAYFDCTDPLSKLNRFWTAIPGSPLRGLAEVRVSFLPDRNWVAEAMAGFRPVRAGNHFLIHPSWEVPAAGPDQYLIQIDPQQAFGTGSHETTRLCVQLLEQYFRPGMFRCLEAGCGSGILLLCLDRWIRRLDPAGADRYRLTGVEIDGPSVTVARENLALNGHQVPAEIHHAALEDFAGPPYHFIFANLLSGILLQNLEHLHGLLEPDGLIIMTGLLVQEEEQFIAGWPPGRFRVLEARRDGDWLALVARRSGGSAAGGAVV